MPTREEERKALLDKANSLPLTPGVYIMKDREGRVIYVGKSRKLKNRVSQYFQNGEKNIKTTRMVASVGSFEYFLCDTEMEALTLENTLIKQHNPKYNIRLKDAKSYPYIKITDEAYPRIIMTRKREKDKGKYFGPYSGVSTVFSVLDTLRRILALPTCNRRFPKDIGRERPCLYYQMGRCCGPCTGKVSEAEYAATVSLAADILRGNTGEVKRRLTEQMYAHAEAERYEAAARCRDTLAALERLQQKQTVVASPDTEQDVSGYYGDDIASCVAVFYIRGGGCGGPGGIPGGRRAHPGRGDLGGVSVRALPCSRVYPQADPAFVCHGSRGAGGAFPVPVGAGGTQGDYPHARAGTGSHSL